MKFEEFCRKKNQALQFDAAGTLLQRYENVETKALPPLILAYMGDSWFDLFVRRRLLDFEQSKVRILHEYDAVIVSATMQALALREIAAELTEEEQGVVRRGRNAKSTVPKSATVRDYRSSTGFEALFGFLYLEGRLTRLAELAEKSFTIIAREMMNFKENKNDESNAD